MHLVFFFFTGLAIGSFLNALVYRLHGGISILGRSFCPKCRKKIAWFDNIPLVSFLLLRGRCRVCQKPISFRYPTIEFITGLTYVAVGLTFFSPYQNTTWIETGGYLIILSFLIAVAAYDLSYMEVPLIPAIMGIVLTLAFLFFQGLSSPSVPDSESFHPFVSGLLGGSLLALFFFVLVYFSRETWMGWGDVWIGFFGGLLVGWPHVFFLLSLASSLGAVVGIGMILLGRKKMNSALPFVPFLAAGTLITLFMEERFSQFFPFLFL